MDITLFEVIDGIGEILRYLVPGFAGLRLYMFATGKKCSKEFQLIASCVASYIFGILAMYLAVLLPEVKILSDYYGRIISTTILSSVFFLAYAWLLNRDWFEKFCLTAFHTSPKENLLTGILDKAKGSNVEVFFKDKDYSVYGHYRGRDEADNGWFAIQHPTLRYSDTREDEGYHDHIDYVCRIEDIDHIIVD